MPLTSGGLKMALRPLLLSLMGGMALLVAAAPGAASARGSASCGWLQGHPPKTYKHVIVVVMENHRFSQIDGSSPYLNSLAKQCGLAANYSAITHPSLPNYIALTSGDTQGISNDCTSCNTNASSIFQQLGSSGWRAYEESMPSPGFTGGGSDKYRKKHNPAAYYTTIAAAYGEDAVPLGTQSAGALLQDLKQGTLPRFSFVTPNMCDDEHDCDVSAGDAWLGQWVPRILGSPAYRRGGTALFITYDEGRGGDNRVYTVVASPYTRPGTVSKQAFSHYSLLKTIESMLGLPCLGHACDSGTASMRKAFGS
jgi:phosphatidylinositol-3-phosphatase